MSGEKREGEIGRLLRGAGEGIVAAASAAWAVVRAPLIFALQLVAAVILIFEQWGWQPLMALLDRLARFRIWARVEATIASLPPYAALAALALPTSLLLPLKFVAVFLLAGGHTVAAAVLFFAAKVASTAIIARIFLLTKPALMRIGWFRSAFEWIVPWQEAMFAMIRNSWVWRYGRMVKSRVRLAAKQLWARWQPLLATLWTDMRAGLRSAWQATVHWGRSAWTELTPRLREQNLRLRRAADRLMARLRRA